MLSLVEPKKLDFNTVLSSIEDEFSNQLTTPNRFRGGRRAFSCDQSTPYFQIYTKEKQQEVNFRLFLLSCGSFNGRVPGQEYLEQIYDAIASSNNPDLLEALEKFVSSQVDAVQQKDADNERLDAALRRAMEKNSEMARHLEEEMEQQMQTLESKIRDEERRKAERMLLEAQWKIEAKASELQAMNEKLEQTLRDTNDDEDEEELRKEIEDKIDENLTLQSQLREYQTQMAIMRSEIASLKSEYDEQGERLVRERQTVLQCVQEQENLTRQLHLLHEANKKLHDTNDDLRAALETKRGRPRSPSPIKRSSSFSSPHGYYRKPSLFGTRSDGDDQSSVSSALSPSPLDDEVKSTRPPNHQPYGDDEDVNESSLMSELIAADEKMIQALNKPKDDENDPYSYMSPTERENFAKQLEILCETNKRLSQSNDELRNALAIVAEQVQRKNKKSKKQRPSSANSDYASGIGSRSESPNKENTEMEKPNSTSSPLRSTHRAMIKLSQYARRGSDEEFDEDDMEDDELVRLVDMTSGSDSETEAAENVSVEEERGTAVGADAPTDSVKSNSPPPNTEPERMYKLVLAGNAAVGKSSFIIRLCKGRFYTALNSTLGVDFQVKILDVDGHVIALQLWDTAGQERFRSIAKSYFRKVDGVLLLYDVTCETSFKDVRDWLESVEESAQKPVPIMICGNKIDLRSQLKSRGERFISRAEGERLAKEVGAFFIETSAKDGSNITEACVELARKLYKNETSEVQNGGLKLNEEDKNEQKKKSSCCK